jgi:hypothetical protein
MTRLPEDPWAFGGLEMQESLVLVAHACNPSYLRGRDQKDQGS